MPFPTGWPPRPASGRRSIRYYQTGTVTAAFDDNGYLFIDGTGANPFKPLPYIAPGSSTQYTGGDLTKGGSPMGTGENSNDFNTSTGEAVPKAMLWAGTIEITAIGTGDIEVSFDGTNVHGYVPQGQTRVYRERYEAGIALRGVGGNTPDFRIEAW